MDVQICVVYRESKLVIAQNNEMKQQHQGQYQVLPQIELHPSISKKQIQRLSTSTQFESQFFTLILYNYLETPKLEQFLQTSIEAQGELCLVRKQIKTGHYQFVSEDEKEFQYFLLYMVNENTPLVNDSRHDKRLSGTGEALLYELRPILTTLVGLSDKVVVYDLDKEKEAFVEKLFVDSVTTCQKIKWQTTLNRVHRLVFIRECYNEQKMPTHPTTKPHSKQFPTTTSSNLTATTSMDTLQYYSSLQQYKEHTQQQKQRYMYFRSQFELVNDNQFVDKLVKEKKVTRKISLKEVLHIYEKVMQMMMKPIEEVVLESLLMQFLVGGKENSSDRVIDLGLGAGQKFALNEPWKVRYYIEKVYELETVQRLYANIEQQIFYPDVTLHRADHVRKQLKKYLSTSPNFRHNHLIFSHANFSHFDYVPSFVTQVSLSADSRQKLLWKLNRLQKYQRQLHEQAKISPLISADKLLYELQDDEITYWLQKYAQKWMEKSLAHLKTYFNKIANQKDHKSIQQFKQQCYKMQERINKVDTSMYTLQKQALIHKIRSELKSFVEYHNDVIEMRRFSGLVYFWKDAAYMVKHKENVRNKLILFVLVVFLALMQKNVIAGLTIGTMALIVLAIRL